MRANDYLNPANFVTAFDRYPGNTEYAQQQYDNGLRIGHEFAEIHISETGVWSASSPNRLITSYETIGLHACTCDLLHGFLCSGAPIFVYDDGLKCINRP